MSYLLDKKNQRKKLSYAAIFLVVFLVLVIFKNSIFNNLSGFSNKIFKPVLVSGSFVGERFRSLGAYFVSKKALYTENENLKSELALEEGAVANYNSIVADNTSLKEILGRKADQTNSKKNMILSAILSKPNQSPYDTLLIDVGEKRGIKIRDTVFALGNVPIGYISDVYENSSKVILFSNSGEKTEAVMGNGNFMEITGRGGGNFEMLIPKGLTFVKGDEVVMPGINSYVLATVETIISDPRDSFVKAILVSPVNVQGLKFVEVGI